MKKRKLKEYEFMIIPVHGCTERFMVRVFARTKDEATKKLNSALAYTKELDPAYSFSYWKCWTLKN